jgi:AcrR family transcriptional regulator
VPAKKPKTRAEAKENTRAELIAAAREEFAARGLEASLDAICARAGLTRGAFYVHFADREALIVAVMDDVLGGFVAALTALLPESGGVAQVIALFFAAAEQRAPAIHAGGGLRFYHLMEACHRSKAVGDRYRAIVVEARDRLAAGVAHDQRAKIARRRVPSDALADLLVLAGLGVSAMFELEIPLDVGAAGSAMLELLREPKGPTRRRAERRPR